MWKRIILSAMAVLAGTITVAVWLNYRAANQAARISHCVSNLCFVRGALRDYREKHGAYPYLPEGGNEEILRLLSESDWLHPTILRDIVGRPADSYPRYYIANRSPEEWRRLSGYGAGKLSPGMVGEWPVVWCRVSPRCPTVPSVTVNVNETGTEYVPCYSVIELERKFDYIELVKAAGTSIPNLDSIEFFDWGFQRRIAATIGRGLNNLKDAKRNSLGMLMVPVPGGRFKMGITPETAEMLRKREADEVPKETFSDGTPRHDVEVDAFRASFEPVSPETWQVYLKNIGREREKGPKRNSWNDAMSFCKWLTHRERASGLIQDSEAYRLPTEAEWEWMMLGGSGGPFPYGNDYPGEDEQGVYPYSLINSYGIVAWNCDMEFCVDKYDSTFYTRSPVVNPVCLEAMVPDKWKERVLRGGNWGTRWSKSGKPGFLSDRGGIAEESGCGNVGFRVVLARTYLALALP